MTRDGGLECFSLLGSPVLLVTGMCDSCSVVRAYCLGVKPTWGQKERLETLNGFNSWGHITFRYLEMTELFHTGA